MILLPLPLQVLLKYVQERYKQAGPDEVQAALLPDSIHQLWGFPHIRG